MSEEKLQKKPINEIIEKIHQTHKYVYSCLSYDDMGFLERSNYYLTYETAHRRYHRYIVVDKSTIITTKNFHYLHITTDQMDSLLEGINNEPAKNNTH